MCVCCHHAMAAVIHCIGKKRGRRQDTTYSTVRRIRPKRQTVKDRQTSTVQRLREARDAYVEIVLFAQYRSSSSSEHQQNPTVAACSYQNGCTMIFQLAAVAARRRVAVFAAKQQRRNFAHAPAPEWEGIDKVVRGYFPHDHQRKKIACRSFIVDLGSRRAKVLVGDS